MIRGADIPLIALLVFALLLAIFLAAAEASLLRVTEVRARSLADTGDSRAQRLAGLLGRLPKVLNLILLLALLAQIGSATITGILAQRWFGDAGVTIASITLTILLFIYGEAIPKTYAIRHAENVARFISGPVMFVERVLRPLVALLVWIADIQLPGPGITTSPTVTEDELKLLAGEAVHEGEITEHDRELIVRAFRFGDRRADDIMVARPDIVAVESTTPIDEAIEVALSSGHRRIPIYKDTLENVVGVVRLRDLIAARNDGPGGIDDFARPHLVIPESKRITRLLSDMQKNSNHLAIVVDEYGVTVGLVTIEDVAEELLGSISDEPGDTGIEQIGEGGWRVTGSLPIEDLTEMLAIDLPSGEWNTVAGMMIGMTGELLTPGEHIDVHGYRITVEAVEDRRITEVTIQRLDGDQDEEE